MQEDGDDDGVGDACEAALERVSDDDGCMFVSPRPSTRLELLCWLMPLLVAWARAMRGRRRTP
jgi:hypothetical protein